MKRVISIVSSESSRLGISAIAIIGAIVAVNVGANQYPSKPTINSGYGSSATAGYSNSSNYSKQTQLSNLKAKIEAGRSRHDELQRQLQPSIDELSSLDARMKSLNDEIETLDRRKPFQNQWDVDRYNARVNAYNNLLAQYRELVASKRGGLQVLSDLEEQDTTLVNQYNALLKGSK
jgi:chromosome segregation ATPase